MLCMLKLYEGLIYNSNEKIAVQIVTAGKTFGD